VPEKARPVFENYKAVKYSKKFLAEHEADIAIYRAVRVTMDRLLNGAKLPKMDTLKVDYVRLTADKKKAYREYRQAKKDMQELITVKANIDHLLGLQKIGACGHRRPACRLAERQKMHYLLIFVSQKNLIYTIDNRLIQMYYTINLIHLC
jgi:hypothetical protein